MGVFNLLRVKMGSVLIVIIGLSLVAFLLTDLLGNNSFLMGQNQTEIGEIAGNTINIQEYQEQVEEMKYNYALNTGRNPTEAEMTSIRQQAWDFLIVKLAFQKEFEKLGVVVTEEEMVDMVQGKNIHPIVRQNFTNPETGEFDKEQLVAILQQVASMPPEQQMQWYQFERSLLPARQREKYENLLFNANIASTEEAIRRHKEQTETAEVKYLYVPYYSVVDSLINLTDDELKAHIKKNESKYKKEATRSLRYISFDVLPSKEDSSYLRTEMEKLKEQFAKVSDDSAFARANTDLGQGYRTYSKADLPKIVASNLVILKEGDILGPYIENGAYVLYKLSDITESKEYQMKASHILIKPDGEEASAKSEAKKKAEDILRKARAGENFEDLARENGMDGTATRGGDLGWFREGMMVEQFNDAAFAATSTGIINKVIETDFGYHVIKVTEVKTNVAYKVAEIYREIFASDATIDKAFRKADYFASNVTNYNEFKTTAEKEAYDVKSSVKLTKNQRRLGNIPGSREIVRWAFNDAKINQVSDVFETDEGYVVAVLVEKSEEGLASLDDVRAQVKREVLNRKKYEYLSAKIAENKGKSLEEMAEIFGDDAKVQNTSDLKMNTNSLPSAGTAPKAIGIAFALEEGQRSEPIEANSGVILIELISKTTVGDIADYTTYKEQLQQARLNTISNGVKQTIEEKANIKDDRYKFY